MRKFIWKSNLSERRGKKNVSCGAFFKQTNKKKWFKPIEAKKKKWILPRYTWLVLLFARIYECDWCGIELNENAYNLAMRCCFLIVIVSKTHNLCCLCTRFFFLHLLPSVTVSSCLHSSYRKETKHWHCPHWYCGWAMGKKCFCQHLLFLFSFVFSFNSIIFFFISRKKFHTELVAAATTIQQNPLAKTHTHNTTTKQINMKNHENAAHGLFRFS